MPVSAAGVSAPIGRFWVILFSGQALSLQRRSAGALVIKDLGEDVQDVRQVGLIGHDLADVLVGAGILVDQGGGRSGVPGLALHLCAQACLVELLLGITP